MVVEFIKPTECQLVLLLALAVPAAVTAQGTGFSADLRRDYRSIRTYFLRAAEEMPDSAYAFKPSPDVRTFAQQVAHVADDQYNLCSPARGETRKAASTDIENRLSAKSDLLQALQTAFAYCDIAYDSLTDASGGQTITAGKVIRARFAILNWNVWHTWEHYGNIVVYLRMNGLVPPTSQRLGMRTN